MNDEPMSIDKASPNTEWCNPLIRDFCQSDDFKIDPYSEAIMAIRDIYEATRFEIDNMGQREYEIMVAIAATIEREDPYVPIDTSSM